MFPNEWNFTFSLNFSAYFETLRWEMPMNKEWPFSHSALPPFFSLACRFKRHSKKTQCEWRHFNLTAKLSGSQDVWARAQGLEKIERERKFSSWARAQQNFLSALKLWILDIKEVSALEYHPYKNNSSDFPCLKLAPFVTHWVVGERKRRQFQTRKDFYVSSVVLKLILL